MNFAFCRPACFQDQSSLRCPFCQKWNGDLQMCNHILRCETKGTSKENHAALKRLPSKKYGPEQAAFAMTTVTVNLNRILSGTITQTEEFECFHCDHSVTAWYLSFKLFAASQVEKSYSHPMSLPSPFPAGCLISCFTQEASPGSHSRSSIQH